MKSGTLTFHRTTNYGAVFQTYALQQCLIKMGIENEVVDYRSPILEERYRKKSPLFYLRPKQLAKVVLQNAYIRDNRKSFMEFSQKNIIISADEYDPDNIIIANEKYDCFIVGSDQVWNGECMGWDPVFLLSFAETGKKNSYAASFGMTALDPDKEQWYKELFQDYSHVSVRENSGRELFERLSGKTAYTVLDPTLLLDKRDWSLLASSVPSQMKQPYIVLYLLKETKSIISMARSVSKRYKMPVVYINDRLIKKKGVINRFYTTPYEWLNLFYNAAFVLTNSFHGTAFSINFNIPFAVQLLPPPSKVNSRITDLLEMCHCTHRIIDNEKEISLQMDFEIVNNVIKEQRVLSESFISSIFSEEI